MGYYTEYEINTMQGEIVNFLGDQHGYSFNPFDSPCKWYNHEKDMKAFSEKHPDRLFKLTGVGEDFPDLWTKFFKNGSMYRKNAEITWPEYDGSLD